MGKLNSVTFGHAEAVFQVLGGVEATHDLLRGAHPLQMKAPDLHFRVRVDNASFAERLAALKRPWHIDETLARTLRQSEQGEVELVLVRCIDRQGLDLEDASAWMRGQGLRFVDPFVLMAWNAAHPEFSYHCRNLTQWQSPSDVHPAAAMFGKSFSRHLPGVQFELQYKQHRTWGPEWWFAGTPIL